MSAVNTSYKRAFHELTERIKNVNELKQVLAFMDAFFNFSLAWVWKTPTVMLDSHSQCSGLLDVLDKANFLINFPRVSVDNSVNAIEIVRWNLLRIGMGTPLAILPKKEELKWNCERVLGRRDKKWEKGKWIVSKPGVEVTPSLVKLRFKINGWGCQDYLNLSIV